MFMVTLRGFTGFLCEFMGICGSIGRFSSDFMGLSEVGFFMGCFSWDLTTNHGKQ